jgi:hypothetical protein
MSGRWIRAAATGCVLASIAWAPIARAQGSNKAAAEALFDEGRKLIAQKNPAAACPKFVESQRLDPSPSTLLNLGNCYERLGKTASAWATYREAASAAYAMNRPTLMASAQRHAAALEPDLTRLTITAAEPVEGLEIKRDATSVGRGEWDVAVPVDPAVITVEATAPRKKKWSTAVEVSERGKTVTVTVPALEDAPEEPRAEERSPAVAAPPSAVYGPTEPPPPSRATTQKTIALVAGGVGVVGVVVGTIFVLNAKSKYDDSKEQCPTDPNLCSAQGVALRDDARNAGNIATVAYIGGAVLVGTGVVLYLTAPKSSEAPRPATAVRLFPTMGGVAMAGRW